MYFCRGRPAEALAYYEKGFQGGFEEKHTLACEAGIARTSILCGDYATGLKIVMGPNSTRQLLNDCAELLNNAKVSFWNEKIDKSSNVKRFIAQKEN